MLSKSSSFLSLASVIQSTRPLLPSLEHVLEFNTINATTNLQEMSNCLIPNFLFLGQYPFPVKKKGCSEAHPRIEVCETHLRSHLMAKHKLTAFCSLQRELPQFADSMPTRGTFTSDPVSGAFFMNYHGHVIRFAKELSLPSPYFIHVR
jgi:hypothetical protein